jgi:hypothetical protein
MQAMSRVPLRAPAKSFASSRYIRTHTLCAVRFAVPIGPPSARRPLGAGLHVGVPEPSQRDAHQRLCPAAARQVVGRS